MKKENNQYKRCNVCGSMIPTNRTITKKESLIVGMPYGKHEIPMISHECPICNSWLFAEIDQDTISKDKFKNVLNYPKPKPVPNPYKHPYEPTDLEKVVKVNKIQPKQTTANTSKKVDKNNIDTKTSDKKPKGVVIVIEGTDGSGKRTQSELLLNKLLEMGIKASLYSFPNYESIQGQIVKRYLNGEFKDQPTEDKLNEYYRNALLYTTDRLVTCMEKGTDGRSILDKYNDGEVIIFDRYTQSNFIHQGCHIENKDDLTAFVNYFTNLEYNMLGLPKPDKVIYLKVLPEVCMQNIEKRGNEKDIHENLASLIKANNHTDLLAKMLEWNVVDCNVGIMRYGIPETLPTMRPKDYIHKEVFTIIEKVLVENNHLGNVNYCTKCYNNSKAINILKMIDIKNNPDLKIAKCPICDSIYDTNKL
ncbi:deoxynucleoside kinase [Romboutsia ilealis]|uniref:deoxynucleoside kinase n=1 Tax=Romboutsia ilealis TaxID=1115758 RepID=UPI0027297821|nr:deoxynucleoside kinase [Romboutsia ilealis]